MKSKDRFIRDVMTQRVVSVPSTISIRDVAKVMEENDITGVAVASPVYGIMGVVTECDILRHFRERNWELLTAEEIMTPDVEVVMPETPIEQAAEIMNKRHIHRLVVMGRDLVDPPMPVGIISASDIVREIGKGNL